VSESGVLPPPERKAAYVRAMFGRIARRYDLMNRLMTFGRDRAWRRYTVARLGLPVTAEPPGRTRVLDVATGTGDLAREVLHQRPDAQIVGLDFASEMLALARRKESGSPISWVAGDALHLPFASGAFDGLVTGFALRNVVDIPAAFAEMARVTRPGGRMACLEMARPPSPLFRRLFDLYFYRIVPLVGALVSGQRAAYTYLPHSVAAFLTPEQIAEVMRAAGWAGVNYRRLALGTVAVHDGTLDWGNPGLICDV
jgi:demethylmenaquinone methyltransferase/2-methoxy-6-polyprenyl-1,4-benzoquinol methylase